MLEPPFSIDLRMPLLLGPRVIRLIYLNFMASDWNYPALYTDDADIQSDGACDPGWLMAHGMALACMPHVTMIIIGCDIN